MTHNNQTQKTNTKVIDMFNVAIRWIDVNIIPIIALPILSIGFADDIRLHATHVAPQAAMAIGIAVAALLAVKARR